MQRRADGDVPPTEAVGRSGRPGWLRKGHWLHLQEVTGQSGAGQAGGHSAGPQSQVA